MRREDDPVAMFGSQIACIRTWSLVFTTGDIQGLSFQDSLILLKTTHITQDAIKKAVITAKGLSFTTSTHMDYDNLYT